MHCVKIKLLQG